VRGRVKLGAIVLVGELNIPFRVVPVEKRCGICRMLQWPGVPHSHKTSNRVVRSILGLSS
jgi:hypothetical protein